MQHYQQFHPHHQLTPVPYSELYKAEKALKLQTQTDPHNELSPIIEGKVIMIDKHFTETDFVKPTPHLANLRSFESDPNEIFRHRVIDHSYSVDTNTSLIGHASNSSSFSKSDSINSHTDSLLSLNHPDADSADLDAEQKEDDNDWILLDKPSGDDEELKSSSLFIDSPQHDRYKSPLLQKILGGVSASPIVKINYEAGKTEFIPEDGSINNLLNMANMIPLSARPVTPTPPNTPIVDAHALPTIQINAEEAALLFDPTQTNVTNPTNLTNDDDIKPEESNSLIQSLVAEKRPSMKDPEEVLLENLIPGQIYLFVLNKYHYKYLLGSIAEREHLKWMNAAPIENNPYSKENLQRRLSESDHKSKVFDINHKIVDALVEESESKQAEEKEAEENLSGPKPSDYKRFVLSF